MPEFWVDHLSRSLSDQGLVAYIWYIDEDRVEWAGDMKGAFGFDRNEYPEDHAAFNGLINPQFIPERLSAVHDVVSRHVNGEVEASFSLEYGLRHKDGSYTQVIEKAGLYEEKGSRNRILCGTLTLKEQAARICNDDINNVTAISNGISDQSLDTQQNRTILQEKIRAHFDTMINDSQDMAVSGYLLAVGLDRTSLMNEEFGSEFTDNYIRQCWNKLIWITGGRASVQRIDGDVFGLFFSEGSSSIMAETAQRILYCFQEEPLKTLQGLYSVSVSIGGICAEDAFCEPATMVTRSEMAMQMAKEKGRGCFLPYEDVMYEMQQNKISFSAIDKFLSAFYSGRVQLAFQPVMNVLDDNNSSKDSKISFFECFMRFIDENGKKQGGGDFIPALERLGLIQMLDHYVANMAIQELCAFPDISLAINVSARSLSHEQWLRGIVMKLRDRPSVAKRFIVEITETAAMDDIENARKVIGTLQSMGVRVALDDFGAGYTSFSQLKNLGVDIVKIDKSFIRGLSKKENSLFVSALQALANGMNIRTVAEGAETAEDIRALREQGVNYIQGYIYGYPGVERVWLPKNHIQRNIPFNRPKRAEKSSFTLGNVSMNEAAVSNG